MKIRHVSQPDYTGCGLAVVAMITGKTYSQIKRSMIDLGIFKSNCDDWRTSFKDLKTALERHNIKTSRRRRFKRWRDIPAKVAIASTDYDKTGNFHWILFLRDNEGLFIYDPAESKRKIRDLRGRVTGHFIEILL